MILCWEAEWYLIQSTHYTQVLTGVLAYSGIHDYDTIASRIKSGKRPPRPRNKNANQWLRDGVWGMITTCWSENRKKQWDVSAIHKLFSTLGLQEVQNANSGN